MKKRVLAFTFGATLLALGVVGCGPKPVSHDVPFDFDVDLSSGRRNGLMYVGEENVFFNIYENSGVIDGQRRKYSYTVIDGDEYVEVDAAGNLTALQVTPAGVEATVKITEQYYDPQITHYFSIHVEEEPEKKNDGENFASNPEERTRILGKLEEYTMDNMLGGITLFQQGAYMRYGERVVLPVSEPITGYGLGLLTEGSLDPNKQQLKDVTYPTYLHTGSSSDPKKINAWDATGSQVSDLNSYITSSFWGTRIASPTTYEWYPVLAKDKIDGEDFLRPIPMEEPNELEMYKKWRIYVKTDEIAYRTNSTIHSEFNNRVVSIKDYEFAFQLLLTEHTQLVRGTELAADTTYGIKGGQTFWRMTKDMLDQPDSSGVSELDTFWKKLQDSGDLGIHTGHDDSKNADYIDIELVSPIDAFTAMYTLSSNLYSPIPEDFLRAIGGGDYTNGARTFGTFDETYGARAGNAAVIDNTLCLGAFYLEEWQKNVCTVYSRNDSWFEVGPQSNRYKIPGLYIKIVPGETETEGLIFQNFKSGQLDYASLPKNEKFNDLTDYVVEGDSTFKLNVNSCTQERWNELNEELWHQSDIYNCKPQMSNNNFLKGLFWSINRKAFAEARGATPSVNYFADTYLSDPENGGSYNATEEHKNAIRNYHNGEGKNNDYGYNTTTARKFFAKACKELTEQGLVTYGTPSNPTKMYIDIMWMYQSDIEDYGKEIKKYFEDAFNDDTVCGHKLILEVRNDAVFNWEYVYNKYLMIGKYDLGFGAISGNSYNPLNFMEVLKSDNSSKFTLNWGPDTSKVDEKNPITYGPLDPTDPEHKREIDVKSWSYDALWAAGDHGAVIEEGKNIDPIKKGYLDNQQAKDGVLANGGSFDIVFQFADVDAGKDPEDKTVDLKVTEVKLFLAHAESKTLTMTNPLTFIEDGRMKFAIDATTGAAWNDEIFFGDKSLQTKAEIAKETYGEDSEEYKTLRYPFRFNTYDIYWNIEIHYTLQIKGGAITENAYTVKYDKDDKITRGYSFARM